MTLTAVLAIFAVVILAAGYVAVLKASTRQADEDARTTGIIVVAARTYLHASSDPLPAGMSEEDYAAFWSEPAMNTPDAAALLDLLNQSWKEDLRRNQEYWQDRAATIQDPVKRTSAQTAVDEVSALLSQGTAQRAKRIVFDDLAELARRTCHRAKVNGVTYLDNGRPIINWYATGYGNAGARDPLESEDRRTQALVEKVYPVAFEAAHPYVCTFPPPPESDYPADEEHLSNIVQEAENLLRTVHVHPNAEGHLSEEDYEAFWNGPVMTSPNAQSYLDRVGEQAVSDSRGSAMHLQAEIDQIQDSGVRDHARQYLDAALSEVAKDNGRRLAVGMVHADLEQYWEDTCVSEPDSWTYPKSVKRNRWTSQMEPEFSSRYLHSAWSGRDTGWSETTFELALQFYPEAYEAGLEEYCT
ncbi:hypothetical protein LJ753_09930 [Arthrobacter sp. zg-Y20]|uniref:hypothetical protein n=1 Tax=unclassified Arthrobacter TaxID=235627 RepID=UPI001D153F05|nr:MULTISPECIES: hypothetical protein [unclassified Arthrobacter]MCC3276187.1 hypothetical protein [Arthrobacter sp. zg-Y20]MDK1316347.1 hypothetical protein [Arthrobacter sp. zg.Y20]WIB06396.1 hypothetical protein QNO06_01245 [Arthrobacter sp. zg-Y20]